MQTIPGICAVESKLEATITRLTPWAKIYMYIHVWLHKKWLVIDKKPNATIRREALWGCIVLTTHSRQQTAFVPHYYGCADATPSSREIFYASVFGGWGVWNGKLEHTQSLALNVREKSICAHDSPSQKMKRLRVL